MKKQKLKLIKQRHPFLDVVKLICKLAKAEKRTEKPIIIGFKSKEKKMCKDCFDEQYYGFTSQSEFENFEGILDLKCKSGKIKILDSKSEVENELIDFRMYYQCITCKEKFVMSIPDNAWRGYFLTEKNAIEYHEKTKTSDKKKKNGCLIILFLIIILTVYSILK